MPSQGKTAELAGGLVTHQHASLLDAGAKEIPQALRAWDSANRSLRCCWCGSGAGQPMQRMSSAWGASYAPSLVPGPEPGPASWEMQTVLPGRIPDLQLGVELGRGKRRKGLWPARKDPLWDLTLGGAEDVDLSSEVQKGCHIPHWTPKASVCPTA